MGSSNIQNLTDVIAALPSLVMYIVPGYVLLWSMAFTLSRQFDNDRHLVLKSIILSYVLTTLGDCVLAQWDLAVASSDLAKAIVIGISFVIGFALSRIILTDQFSRLLRFLGINRSFHVNLWNDIADLECGLWVTVYLPEEKVIYQGQLRRFNDNAPENATLLVLSNYKLFSYSGNLISDRSTSRVDQVIINTNNISRIELLYSEKSRKS